jgi:para-aminobenzoate synthetase component I
VARVDPLPLAGVLGLPAPAIVTVEGWHVVAADPIGTIDDLGALDDLAAAVGWREQPPDRRLPFTGGAIGLLSDDLAPGLLELDGAAPLGRPAPAPLPPVAFDVYDTAVCIPPVGDRAWVVASDLPGSTRPAAQRARRWQARLHRTDPTRGPASHDAPSAAVPSGPRATASLGRAAHRRAVLQAQEWIAAGDLYQLNLTLQLAVPWGLGGSALARRLWAASPGAAHAAYLSRGEVDVVSVSPETFLRVHDGLATVRPIKGTRPRHDDPVADAAEAAALQASAKDAAEHVMIVDLERNDLGRVCMPGTVRVPVLAGLEAHPTVWHLTSTVQGRLRPDVRLSDLLAATFPCGSVTGAPKRMAWDRISRLEPVRRGVYCGAIGLVTAGRVDLSVAIRTAVLHEGVASYGTGGGIVADSDPDAEWDEAMHKARAFLVATGAEQPA